MNKAPTEPLYPANPPEPLSLKPTGPAPKSNLRAGLQSELAPIVASLRSPLFYLALLVSFLGLGAAYQMPFSKVVSINSVGDRAYLVDYYAREQNKEGFVYRWTQPSSNVRLPGMGQPGAVRVKVELSPRPPDAANTIIDMHVNGERFRQVELDRTERTLYQLEYIPARRSWFDSGRNDLDFWMKMEPYLAKGDRRPFGVVVSRIEIEGSGLLESGRPTVPPWSTLAALLGGVAGVGLIARRASWSGRGAALIMVAAALPFAAGVAINRPIVGHAALLFLIATGLVYFFVMTGLLFTGWWLARRGLLLSIEQARWLGIIFMLAFLIRAVGINHPAFQVIDHGFRIHETYAILNDPGLIISRYFNMNTFQSIGAEGEQVRSIALGQWDMAVAIPYSPLFYLSDLPLAAILRTNEPAFLYWTNLFALWWETSSLFLLYIIARQGFGRFGNIAGLVGGVLLNFFPLSFLMPSDGGYPSMQAQWLSLLFIAIVSGWFHQARERHWLPGWRGVAGGGAVLGLALLAHTATLLLLSSLVAGLLALLFVAGGRFKYLFRPLAATAGLGLVISFGLYYGFYVGPLLTKTLPGLAGKLGQGEKVGEKSQTLKGFWPELAAHFHFFPFVVTLAVIGYMVYAAWKASRPPQPGEGRGFEAVAERELGRPVVLMLVAWLSTFGLYSVAATRINLLHKHMLFAMPLFALGCGLGLAMLGDYLAQRCKEAGPALTRPNGRALELWVGQGLLAAVVVYFVAAGSYTWFIRVINYVLPSGTG